MRMRNIDSSHSSIVEILEEHNKLNGFKFVLVEFAVTSIVATFIAYAGLSGAGWLYVIAGLGVLANSISVAVSVIGQMRRGDKDLGLYSVYFGEGRGIVKLEHPNLGRNTSKLVVSLMVPFLLAFQLTLAHAKR